MIVAVTALIAAHGSSTSAATKAKDRVRAADVSALLAEIRKPGARAVLVNVWATWCEPCREEMPGLLSFFREHRREGLRLILVSVDEDSDRDKVSRFLAEQRVDFPSWLKQGDDMRFIDAIDPKWSGALPATFLFDGEGRLDARWYGQVTPAMLSDAWRRAVLRGKGTSDGTSHDQASTQHPARPR